SWSTTSASCRSLGITAPSTAHMRRRSSTRCASSSRPTTGKPNSREPPGRTSMNIRSRWLGTVPYAEAEALQRAIHEHAATDYLLLQEHPHVYTLGSSAKPEHVLRDPASVGAALVHADRG